MRFVLLFLLLPLLAAAQKKEVGKAITNDGRRIILYEDGTYRYEIQPVPTSPAKSPSDTVEDLSRKPIGDTYQKSPYNKKEWRSNRTHFSLWFDPKKWRMNLTNKSGFTEVSFHLADAFAEIYTERLDIDFEQWIHHMKLAHKEKHPAMEVQHEEWRTVNGQVMYFVKWHNRDNRTRVQLYSLYAKGNKELLQLHGAIPWEVASDVEENMMRLFTGVVLNEQ